MALVRLVTTSFLLTSAGFRPSTVLVLLDFALQVCQLWYRQRSSLSSQADGFVYVQYAQVCVALCKRPNLRTLHGKHYDSLDRVDMILGFTRHGPTCPYDQIEVVIIR